MQPSEAMASRRGQIYRAHGVERGTRPHEPPPPRGRDKSGPYGHSVQKSYAHPNSSQELVVSFLICYAVFVKTIVQTLSFRKVTSHGRGDPVSPSV